MEKRCLRKLNIAAIFINIMSKQARASVQAQKNHTGMGCIHCKAILDFLQSKFTIAFLSYANKPSLEGKTAYYSKYLAANAHLGLISQRSKFRQARNVK